MSRLTGTSASDHRRTGDPSVEVQVVNQDEGEVMQRLLVLGGGTAGTMVVNKLRRKLDPADWQITIVDQDDKHLYQPGFLFIPFGVYEPADVVRSRHRFIP